MASSAETPDQSRGMSTNEFIAEMNNVRPVCAGQSRKASDSPAKCAAQLRASSTPKRLKSSGSDCGAGPPSPAQIVKFGAGRAIVWAAARRDADPGFVNDVVQPPSFVQPPSIRRRPTTQMNPFDAVEEEPCEIDVQVDRPENALPEQANAPLAPLAPPADNILSDDMLTDAPVPANAPANAASVAPGNVEPGDAELGDAAPVDADAEPADDEPANAAPVNVAASGRKKKKQNKKSKQQQKKKLPFRVPASEFVAMLRKGRISTKQYTEQDMRRDIRNVKQCIMYNFDLKGYREESKSSEDVLEQAPATRSSIIDDDYWVVDVDARNCEVVDTRRLDRYPLEHIFTLQQNTQLLLLVRVIDDGRMFSSKGSQVGAIQDLPRKNINGFEYFQLKCNLSEVSDNQQLHSGVCTQGQFEEDFKRGRGDFKSNLTELQ